MICGGGLNFRRSGLDAGAGMGMGISFDELAGSDGTLRQRSTINLQSPQQY